MKLLQDIVKVVKIYKVALLFLLSLDFISFTFSISLDFHFANKKVDYANAILTFTFKLLSEVLLILALFILIIKDLNQKAFLVVNIV